MNQAFTKRERLLSSKDFDECMNRARKVATEHLLVFSSQTRGPSRLGLILKRKIGNAVIRNRWKRKIREIFRTHKETWGQGLDVVVMVRKTIDDVPALDELRREFLSAVSKRP